MRMTLDEARRAPDRTNYRRLAAMTDDDIARQVASDPDAVLFTDAMLASAVIVMPPSKQLMTLRLDQDVVSWFKSQGEGYQTRMNAVLRSYMLHGAKKR